MGVDDNISLGGDVDVDGENLVNSNLINSDPLNLIGSPNLPIADPDS